MRLTGEIGTLSINGKQVGGFRGWTVFVETKPPMYSWVMAAGYWLFEKVNTNKFTASFYAENEEALELIVTRESTIKLPKTYPLDKMILKPLKMEFKEKFDWRKE